MVKKKVRSIIVWLMGFVLFVAGGYAFISSENDTIRHIREVMNVQELSEKLFPKREDYSFETCYVGDPALPTELFEIPFARSEEYICNKDLVKKYGSSRFETLAEKATEDVSAIFNLAYKDLETLEEIPDIFWYGYAVSDGKSGHYGNDEVMDFIHSVFIDHHTSLETEVITDKSLVFYDQNSYIIRCMLNITPYESDDLTSLAKVLGVETAELGKTYSRMIEVLYVTVDNGSDFNDYSIAEIRTVEKEEEEQ